MSANGNKRWDFDAASVDWHGGWGQGAWTWARHNVTTPTQTTSGNTTALSFALEAPPWGTQWTTGR